MADAIVAKFTGKRDAEGLPLEYHGGIPATDLTQDDVDNLTAEQKLMLATSPVYDVKKKDALPSVATLERQAEREEAAQPSTQPHPPVRADEKK